MSNKYLYISSMDANDHADFEVHFPEQLIIKPYSQIRCISCRINPSDNLIEIDGGNDTFYVGIDHWNKLGCAIPLIRLTLNHGAYNMDNNDDSYLSLNAEVAAALAEEVEAFCLLRGGTSCGIDASRKLSLKMSAMQIYSCPGIALTADVLAFWRNPQTLVQPIIKGVGRPCYPVHMVEATQLDQNNTYYGALVHKDADEAQYYVSPPIVSGLTGTDDGSKHVSHIIEIDNTNNPIALEGKFGDTNDFFRIYYGDALPDELGEYWGANGKQGAASGGVSKMNSRFLYSLEFSNKYIFLKYYDVSGGRAKMEYASVYAGTNYKIASKFQIKMTEWEDENGSYWALKVDMQKDGAGAWAEMALSLPQVRKTVRRYKGRTALRPNRLAFLFNTEDDMTNTVKYTAAVDDVEDKLGFNAVDADFGGRISTADNIPDRLLTVFSDNVSGKKNIGRTALDIMKNAQLAQNPVQYDVLNDIENTSYSLSRMPNADILSWDVDTDQGLVFSTASHSTPLKAQGAVSGNNRDYPSFYLSLPSLPLENVTATYLRGFENRFVTPIELSQSQTSQRLYTSKIYTEQYNTLTNSAPLNMSSMRVRICDINGVPTKQLDKYTILTLEIRDNPYKAEQEFLSHIRRLNDNYDQQPKIVDDQ